VRLASKVYKTIAHSEFEAHSTRGRPKKLWFGGKPIWIEDERIVGAGDEKKPVEYLMLVYNQPDIYLRGPDGNRVQATEDITTDATTLAWLRKNYPAYSERKELAVSGGVTHAVVEANPRAAPLIVQQAPALAEITQDPDADLEEGFGATPVPTHDPVTGLPLDTRSKPIAETDPPEMLTTGDPIPMQASAPPSGEMSELRRDLLERASLKPINPQPKGAVFIGKPSDEGKP
jgi:hypothetical protein